MEHVLQNIKTLRILRNLTQATLAAELNIGTRQYNNLENGKSDFKLSQLSIIAQMLKVRLAVLFSDDLSGFLDRV